MSSVLKCSKLNLSLRTPLAVLFYFIILLYFHQFLFCTQSRSLHSFAALRCIRDSLVRGQGQGQTTLKSGPGPLGAISRPDHFKAKASRPQGQAGVWSRESEFPARSLSLIISMSRNNFCKLESTFFRARVRVRSPKFSNPRSLSSTKIMESASPRPSQVQYILQHCENVCQFAQNTY